MGLESATFISQLVATNPLGDDDYATADDHLRLIKAVLKSQFPNFVAAAMNATVAELNKLDGFTGVVADFNILSGADAGGLSATELMFLNGVTSALQAQLDGKAASAHAHTGAEISNLDTADTTTGIFADARIPNLNASKITAGVLAAARVATHTGDVTGQTALAIAANAVSLAKMADMATASFIGRNTAGSGDPEVLSAAIARAILNVADGSNAYAHPNHSGDVTSVADGAQTIANDAVTYAKMQNVVADERLLGNVAGAGSVIAELTQAQVISFLAIEAGATADQSNAQIKTAYEANADTNAFDDAEQTKLAGIEAAATADQTGAQIEAIVDHDNLQGFVLLEHVNLVGLTTLAGTLVAAGDGALVDDGGVMKRINYRNAGTPVIDVTGTSRTLADDDMNKYVSFTNAAAISVVLNNGVGEKGNMIVLEQHAAGQITVSGTATINGANGLKTAKQFAVIVLFCRATNNWVLHGDAVA